MFIYSLQLRSLHNVFFTIKNSYTVAESSFELRIGDNAQRNVIMVSACVLLICVNALVLQLSSGDSVKYTYCAAAVAIVLTSFAFLHHPFAALLLTLSYLISPVPMILPGTYSGAITFLLATNCCAGCLLASGCRSIFGRRAFRPLLLCCSVAMAGAAVGVARGNQLSAAFGDFYQIFEFAVLFALTRQLVKTEKRFEALAQVIVGAIIITSVLEMSDALVGAHYLAGLSVDGGDLSRTINMNAPIAFVALLATYPAARNKVWVLAGIGLLAVNLLWSFTRGLWMATAMSVLFLLTVQRGNSRRTLVKVILVSFVVGLLLVCTLGLGSIVMDRISYTAEQLGSPAGMDETSQTLAARRMLEYILILPRIAEHPLLGNGLGATFEISGSAVLEGPKDEQVDHHYIHNLYLLVAFRLGIPALLVFLVALWRYFRVALRNLRALNLSPQAASLMAGLIGAMFGEVLLSLTSPTFLNHPTAGVLGCIAAVTTTTLKQQFDAKNPFLA